MSEKRFSTNGYYINDTFYDGRKWLVNEVEAKEIVDEMNNLDTKARERSKALSKIQNKHDEQQATIKQLQEENDKLRALIKGNVFGRYGEGSLADLEFKAIAYDDIVKLEMSYESEPKVIVICKQGKKENVKSFCQMFIPFGIVYEIKEVIDDE